MNVNQAWEQLNQENPPVDLLKELLSINENTQQEFFTKFCQNLEDGQSRHDNEWSLIHWVRYAGIYQPDAYIAPVLSELKILTTAFHPDEYTDTIIYNSFSSFLDDSIRPAHAKILMEHWTEAEDEDWIGDLLSYLAKAQVDEPEVINSMMAKMEEDLTRASFYLYDFPHPQLMALAEQHIASMAPWYKYIWSPANLNNLHLIAWIELTSSWVRGKFPQEEKLFDNGLSPLESIENWISLKSQTKDRDRAYQDALERNNKYVKWREDKIDQYFLSRLPEDYKAWLNNPLLDEQTKSDFRKDMIRAGLFKLSSVSKNGPCPCGSGKKAKRCCYKN